MLNEALTSDGKPLPGGAAADGHEGAKGPESLVSEKPRGEAGPGYWLRGDDVLVRVGLTAGLCPVILLSPLTAWIEPDYDVDYPFNERVDVTLCQGSREIGPISATVMLQAMMGKRGPFIALRFHDVSAAVGREMLKMLRELAAVGAALPAHAADMQSIKATPREGSYESIERPDRVRAILVALVGSKGIMRRADGSGAPVCVRLMDADDERARWQATDGWGEPPVSVALVGYNSLYRIRLDEAEEQGGEIVTRIPARIERIRQRWLRRGFVREPLTATFEHPLWSSLPAIRREVRDVSFRGMCLTVNADDDLLYVGLKLPLIEITGGELGPIRLSGEVRTVTPASDGSCLCGLTVTPAGEPADEMRWNRLVSRSLYTSTQSGPAWTAALWDLFDTSGYFSLSGKTPAQFDVLKRSFIHIAEKTPALHSLLYQTAWLSGSRVEGTCSIMKPYQGTWMLHQLAKRPRDQTSISSRRVLRDIYLRCFEHAQADVDFRWAIAYAEANVAWNARSHFEFIRRCARQDLVMSMPFQLMEAGARDRIEPSALAFGAATSEEERMLLEQIALLRPRVYAEALDLVPPRFRDIGGSWRSAGLERHREVLIARRGGAPVAAAVVEVGQVGTNLFRLLDSVRLFPLEPGGEAAYTDLLGEVRRWFARRGRESFIYFREAEDQGHTGATDLRDLGGGRLWIVAAGLIPDFLEHVYALTSPKKVR